MKIIKGSENVFEHLDFGREEAANLAIRADLMIFLTRYIEREGITQSEAGKRFGITQSRVSELINGRIDKFTIDKLVNIAARVGFNASVKVKQTKRRLSVIEGGGVHPVRKTTTKKSPKRRRTA